MTEFLYEKKKLVGAQVKDHVTGKTIEVHAAQIVNATGPWVDEVRQKDKVADKSNYVSQKESILSLIKRIFHYDKQSTLI